MANQWLTGSGVPSTGIGQVTDYYRDTVNNLVYYRENAFTWTVVPAFTPNPDGIGTTWLHGNVPPLTGQGSDGDYYYDEVQLIVYRKDGATWVPKGSLDFIGVYGVQWGNGIGAPASTVPLNGLPAGSFYLDVDTSDIYFKPPSMVWELKGQLGGGGGGGSPVTVADVTGAQSTANLSNDAAFATPSSTTYPSTTAVKAYADGLITKVWKDQGNYNVSSGASWPTSANTIGALPIKAGNLWIVIGAATNGTTLTGGIVVSNGDVIRAKIDNATNSAADWAANESNLGYTPENVLNKATALSMGTINDTNYPTVKLMNDNFVGVNAQNLDNTQKAQVKANIGLATADDLSEKTLTPTNLYFTPARAIASLLSTYSVAMTNAVVLATDSIVIALGKLQKQITDLGTPLALTNLRYSFNARAVTSYTIADTDVTPNGGVLVVLTQAGAAIACSLGTPMSLSRAVGDSVNIVQGGAGVVTVVADGTCTFTGASTTGTTAVFTNAGETKTFIAETLTSWRVIGA
jgi:hypothetical protein